VTNYIWVTAEQDFVHKYPDAPRAVSFLRNEHRHNFKFKVYIQVFKNDRDIEFFIFQRLVKGILKNMPYNLEAKSCETIADDLYAEIIKKHPNRKMIIEVSEDGENGAVKQFTVKKPRKTKIEIID